MATAEEVATLLVSVCAEFVKSDSISAERPVRPPMKLERPGSNEASRKAGSLDLLKQLTSLSLLLDMDLDAWEMAMFAAARSLRERATCQCAFVSLF